MDLYTDNILNIKNIIQEQEYTLFIDNNRYNKDIYISTFFNKNVKLLQCDHTASSYPLKIVEKIIENNIYKYYSNTHSNNILGRIMNSFINLSKKYIMSSVNGHCDTDKIIFDGSGASGAINHLIHLIKSKLTNSVVFLSIYEHYSNYLPWYHYADEIVFLDVDNKGLIDLIKYENDLIKYKELKKNIFVSISACSNVLGIIQDINTIAFLCHKYNGLIFIDCATSAPYLPINMHIDDNKGIYLDAIFLSPHKFPGGQSTPGILIINKNIICNKISYTPSGGTVKFCSKNKGPVYNENIEIKENGGTPNIIGIIKCGLIFQIKDLFIKQIILHELYITRIFQKYLLKIQRKNKNLIILNPSNNTYRLPIFAIQILPYHYNFIVILLCDLFGITTRGGINCTSILPEHLLKLNNNEINNINTYISNNKGMPNNYGWIRITLNNIHTKNDIILIIRAINYLCKNAYKYEKYYKYCPIKNNYLNKSCDDGICTNFL